VRTNTIVSAVFRGALRVLQDVVPRHKLLSRRAFGQNSKKKKNFSAVGRSPSIGPQIDGGRGTGEEAPRRGGGAAGPVAILKTAIFAS
jgi:hypothetical protein